MMKEEERKEEKDEEKDLGNDLRDKVGVADDVALLRGLKTKVGLAEKGSKSLGGSADSKAVRGVEGRKKKGREPLRKDRRIRGMKRSRVVGVDRDQRLSGLDENVDELLVTDGFIDKEALAERRHQTVIDDLCIKVSKGPESFDQIVVGSVPVGETAKDLLDQTQAWDEFRAALAPDEDEAVDQRTQQLWHKLRPSLCFYLRQRQTRDERIDPRDHLHQLFVG